MLLYPNITTTYMAFKLLYFYILVHSAHSYGRVWVWPCFNPETSD